MRYLFLCIALFLFCSSAHSAVWYVDDDNSSGPWTGSQQHPFRYIQDGIDAATGGDTVLVMPGYYLENIDFSEKAIAVKSDQGPDVTTIDGGQAGSVVFFKNCESTDSVIEGFTITNGTGLRPYLCGGGIYCWSSKPTITGNIITGNTTAKGGAGIFAVGYNVSPVIIDNVIKENSVGVSGYGGAIFILGDGHNSFPTISRNEICRNTISGGGAGGGICADYSTPTISNNVIEDNLLDGPGAGGGIYIYNKSDHNTRMYHNIIRNNTADYGGGIHSFFGRIDLVGNTIVGNKGEYGGGIYNIGGMRDMNNTIAHNRADWGGGFYGENCALKVTNSIYWDNDAAKGPQIMITGGPFWSSAMRADYSDVERGMGWVYYDCYTTVVWGDGMIDADPLFEGDYHLQAGSPCIDAGDPSSPVDPDGTRADMGAHYHDQTSYFYLWVDPQPLIAGQPAAFKITNGLPNKNVWLVYSITGPGAKYVPSLKVWIDLADPEKGFAGRSDSSGSIDWNLVIFNNIPPGTEVWLQAVQYGQVTNVAATTVE